MTSVAVVIPTRDGAERIRSCLDAIAAQRRQPDEVVVVDNGSRDGTADVARRAGARVLHEARPGSYAARNAGVDATTADIIAFTDDDCEPDPQWLACLATAFDDPAVVGAGGPIVAIETNSAAQRWAYQRMVLSQDRAFRHSFRPYLATANAAYRRAALLAVGGFDASLPSGGDVDLAWRVQETGGQIVVVDDATVRHHHRADVRGLLRQQRRYGYGHGMLDRRWWHDEAYRRTVGTRAARTRAIWLLPARVPVRLVLGRPVEVALIDAAVRFVHEVGRWQGRRSPAVGGSAGPWRPDRGGNQTRGGSIVAAERPGDR